MAETVPGGEVPVPTTPHEAPEMPARALSNLLFEAAPDGMVAIDPEGIIRYFNRRAEIMFGYSREEVMGRPVETLMPEHYRQRHNLHRSGYFAYPRIRPMGLGLDLRGLRKDGTEFPVEISLSPVTHDPESGQQWAIATIRDIAAWRGDLDRSGGAYPASMSLHLQIAVSALVLVMLTALIVMVATLL